MSVQMLRDRDFVLGRFYQLTDRGMKLGSLSYLIMVQKMRESNFELAKSEQLTDRGK